MYNIISALKKTETFLLGTFGRKVKGQGQGLTAQGHTPSQIFMELCTFQTALECPNPVFLREIFYLLSSIYRSYFTFSDRNLLK